MSEKHIISAGIDVRLFDRQPIKLAGFRLLARGIEPVGRPTRDQWTAAAQFAGAVEGSSPYWVGDLLAYAESRQDWQEKLDQMLADTGLARQTLYNHTYIARHVSPEVRDLAPTFSHAKAVAALEPHQQKRVLKKAREEELTVSQTAKLARMIVRPKVVDGQAVLTGKFRVIYADPPWTYDNNTPWADGSHTPAEDHYEGMTIGQLVALPVAAHATKDAVLFMWTTNSHLFENPGPREVMEAWGFSYKTNYVWDKVLGRPGHYSYVQHEVLLVGTRGSCTPDVSILQHDHASIFRERRSGKHSEKPAFARQLVQQLYTHGPYLELFGRKRVDGWSVFGNDASLWGKSEELQ
jgi:N6-adenosine-specific RNA methylase IME4